MTNYALPEISYVLWGIEASYPSATSDTEPATTCDRFFWATQSTSDANKNNLFKVYSIAGGRDIQSVVNGRFESTITIEAFFTNLQTPWQLVLGNLSGVSSPYTATATNTVPSFAVEIGYKDFLGNMKRVKFHGCKLNSTNLSWGKEGDPIKVSLEIYAQKFWINDTLQTPTAPTTAPYVGYETTHEFPQSTTLVGVQNFSFTVGQNLFKQEDTSSRFVIDLIERKRDYTYQLSQFANSGTGVAILQQFMGSNSVVSQSATVTATSGRITIRRTANDQIVMTFPASSVFIEDHTMPLDIGGDLSVVSVNGFMSSLTSVAITNA